MKERLRVRFEMSDVDIRDWFHTPEIIEVRNKLTLALLEDECRDDPDTTRLERLKEYWLI